MRTRCVCLGGRGVACGVWGGLKLGWGKGLDDEALRAACALLRLGRTESSTTWA